MGMERGVQVHLCNYSNHTSEYYQSFEGGTEMYIFRLQSEGVCTISVEDESREVGPGDLTLLPPGTSYTLKTGVRTVDGVELQGASGDYYVFCEGPWVDAWWGRRERPMTSWIIGDGRLLGIWNQLILEKRGLNGDNPELAEVLLQALCLMIDRALEEMKPSAERKTSYLAVRMKHFIEERALTPLKLEEVARHADLSISRTVHLFKEHYGLSVMQYVTKIRLAMAEELLRVSPMTLEQVAAASGFGTYPYFHRVFRARHGLSPGAYRRNPYNYTREGSPNPPVSGQDKTAQSLRSSRAE